MTCKTMIYPWDEVVMSYFLFLNTHCIKGLKCWYEFLIEHEN